MTVVEKLDHPNIVRFVESGSHQGAFYFVMELCDGGSLADVVKQNGGKLSVAQIKPWILQALTGLTFAHSNGFVHRDIKPANILIHRNIARIADFGMAKNFQKAGLSGMSITGQYAGTPLFMPPEQIKNFKYVKPVTDVWSMGATIYNVLTGEFPYTFDRVRDPIDIILNDNVVPIRDRDETIPRPLAEVLDKALAKRHINRFENAGTFLHELTLALK
jgi:serine/threonine protein kinase